MLIRSCPLLLSLAIANPSPACPPTRHPAHQERTCIVSHVGDGDSFRCGDGRKVRLIGIDSPELRQGPFGARARHALSAMIPRGAAVRLEQDITTTDRYGRVLAYAWLGPTMINEAMVRGGWAVLYTVPPNIKYADRLSRVQNEARASGAGLWAQDGFTCLPSDFRRGVCFSPP
jgi:micrococcal nuclease